MRLGGPGSGEGEIPTLEIHVWGSLRLTFQNAGGGVSRAGGRGPRTSFSVLGTRFCSLLTRKPHPPPRLLPAPGCSAAEPASTRGRAGAGVTLGGGAGVSEAQVRSGGAMHRPPD